MTSARPQCLWPFASNPTDALCFTSLLLVPLCCRHFQALAQLVSMLERLSGPGGLRGCRFSLILKSQPSEASPQGGEAPIPSPTVPLLSPNAVPAESVSLCVCPACESNSLQSRDHVIFIFCSQARHSIQHTDVQCIVPEMNCPLSTC